MTRNGMRVKNKKNRPHFKGSSMKPHNGVVPDPAGFEPAADCSSFLPGVNDTGAIISSGEEEIYIDGLERVESMTNLGNWSWNLLTDKILASREVFRMGGLEKTGPGEPRGRFL